MLDLSDRAKGTLLTIEELIETVIGAVMYDEADRAALKETAIAAVNARAMRMQQELEAWQLAPVEVAGVELVPGNWYEVTEAAWSRGVKSAGRVARFCRFVQRRKGNWNGRVAYVFERWTNDAAKRESTWASPMSHSNSWADEHIYAIAPATPTPALLANIATYEQDTALRKAADAEAHAKRVAMLAEMTTEEVPA